MMRPKVVFNVREKEDVSQVLIPDQRRASILSRYSYRAVAILMLNTLIVFACFELAAIGVFKIARVISKPTEQLVGEGDPRETVSYYHSQE